MSGAVAVVEPVNDVSLTSKELILVADTGLEGIQSHSTADPDRTPHRYQISHTPEAPWWPAALPRLNKLRALPENWNRAGASRVSPEAIYPALELIAVAATARTPAPSISPTVSGGIQIEWHLKGLDFEIEVLSSEAGVAVYTDADTGEEWDDELPPLSGRVLQAIRRVAERGA